MAVVAGLYGLTLALGQNPARTPDLDGFASPAVFGGQMPVSGAAGRRVINTFCPVCRPTPWARMEFFSVRCPSICFYLPAAQAVHG